MTVSAKFSKNEYIEEFFSTVNLSTSLIVRASFAEHFEKTEIDVRQIFYAISTGEYIDPNSVIAAICIMDDIANGDSADSSEAGQICEAWRIWWQEFHNAI